MLTSKCHICVHKRPISQAYRKNHSPCPLDAYAGASKDYAGLQQCWMQPSLLRGFAFFLCCRSSSHLRAYVCTCTFTWRLFPFRGFFWFRIRQDAFVSHTLACACTLQRCILTHLSEDVDSCSSATWVAAPGGKKTVAVSHLPKKMLLLRYHMLDKPPPLQSLQISPKVCACVCAWARACACARARVHACALGMYIQRSRALCTQEGEIGGSRCNKVLPSSLPLHMTYCCPATHPYACRLKDDDDAFHLRHKWSARATWRVDIHMSTHCYDVHCRWEYSHDQPHDSLRQGLSGGRKGRGSKKGNVAHMQWFADLISMYLLSFLLVPPSQILFQTPLSPAARPFPLNSCLSTYVMACLNI